MSVQPFNLAIRLTPEAIAAIERWPGLTRVTAGAMAKALDLENDLTVSYAQENKLSGPRPEVLGVISNRLRNAVHATKAQVDGTNIDSAIGDNVEYAAVHEFGFDGDVQVQAHTRRRVIARVGKRNKIQKISVKAFTRHMRMPERSFIRSSISERLPNYNASLSKAVVDVLGGSE